MSGPAPAPGPEGPLQARLQAARRGGFRALLLLLERLVPGAERVGTAAPCYEEPVRFRHDPALAFSPSDVTSVRVHERPPQGEGAPDAPFAWVEVTTAFLGLTGVVSPLPPHLPEEVAQEDPDAPRRREFLDLFHHRSLSLLARALERGDLAGGARSDQADAWSRRVLALLGRDPELPAPGSAAVLLRCAPLLAQPALTAEALAAALTEALADDLGQATATVEAFAGTWVEIPDDQRCRLGHAAAALGRDLIVGRRVFDRAGKFRVVLGPLDAARFAHLRQDGPRRRVAAALAALVQEPLEREVVLALAPEAAPRLALGRARLGGDAFLGGQRRETRLTLDLPA